MYSPFENYKSGEAKVDLSDTEFSLAANANFSYTGYRSVTLEKVQTRKTVHFKGKFTTRRLLKKKRTSAQRQSISYLLNTSYETFYLASIFPKTIIMPFSWKHETRRLGNVHLHIMLRTSLPHYCLKCLLNKERISNKKRGMNKKIAFNTNNIVK